MQKRVQRLKNWYLIPPCLTLSIIRYVSRVKWTNPGKGVAPSPIPRCCSYWKWSLQVTLNYSHQFYFNILQLQLYIYMYEAQGCRICWQHLCRRVRLSPKTSILNNTLYCIWWWGSSPRALGNMYYAFIDITPSSTLTQSGSTWEGSICGASHLTVCEQMINNYLNF